VNQEVTLYNNNVMKLKMKKICLYFLILALLQFIGCYSSEIIYEEDFQQLNSQIDFNEDLYLTTRDSTKYHFSPPNFQIVDDTLWGKGTIDVSASTLPFQGSIAVKEIISFEQNTPDTMANVGAGVGLIAIGAVVLGLLFFAAFGAALDFN